MSEIIRTFGASMEEKTHLWVVCAVHIVHVYNTVYLNCIVDDRVYLPKP